MHISDLLGSKENWKSLHLSIPRLLVSSLINLTSNVNSPSYILHLYKLRSILGFAIVMECR